VSLPLDAVRAAVRREWGRCCELLASGDWAAATRLPGWTVGDLAIHAVWGVSMEADALRRRRTGTGGRADGRTIPAGSDRQTILAELDGALGELRQELDQLTDDDLASTAPLPYGDVPLAVFSQILVMEAGVHTSDLAEATGAPDDLAPDVASATAVTLSIFLPILAGAAEERPVAGTTISIRGGSVHLAFRCQADGWESLPEAAETDATISADDSTVLLFALGRIPPTDARLTITGDQAAGRRFKRWLPGP
jgi:uncharacterized protein (TIGR03083 family)